MLDSIIYFIKDYYSVIAVWIAITVLISGLINGCNKKEIRRLESIIQIEKQTHVKEVEILKTSHEKQMKAIKDINEKYDTELKKINDQYSENLKVIKEQQRSVYNNYLKNQELMSQMLIKYFGIRPRRK